MFMLFHQQWSVKTAVFEIGPVLLNLTKCFSDKGKLIFIYSVYFPLLPSLQYYILISAFIFRYCHITNSSTICWSAPMDYWTMTGIIMIMFWDILSCGLWRVWWDQLCAPCYFLGERVPASMSHSGKVAGQKCYSHFFWQWLFTYQGKEYIWVPTWSIIFFFFQNAHKSVIQSKQYRKLYYEPFFMFFV